MQSLYYLTIFTVCLSTLLSIYTDAFRPLHNNIAIRKYSHNTPRVALKLAVTSEEISETTPAEELTIPKYLPSACGVDYVPLATFLATGDFLSADDFTRNNLIKISGAESKGRNFVYWTEVHGIPAVDLVTMERLWLQFSNGNFGYSVQKRVWDVEKGNFDSFIRRIGWTKVDNGIERKLRWFGQNEFIYDLEKAPKGHLPLTSALRGTQLIKQLLTHPVWDMHDWKNYDKLQWPEA